MFYPWILIDPAPVVPLWAQIVLELAGRRLNVKKEERKLASFLPGKNT